MFAASFLVRIADHYRLDLIMNCILTTHLFAHKLCYVVLEHEKQLCMESFTADTLYTNTLEAIHLCVTSKSAYIYDCMISDNALIKRNHYNWQMTYAAYWSQCNA